VQPPQQAHGHDEHESLSPTADKDTMKNPQDMTREELLEALAAKGTSNGGFKVSAKGALSRYGLGRFPVTLYASQWRKIIADVQSGELQAQLEKNADKLSEKAEQ
jgi:hypothetical protein